MSHTTQTKERTLSRVRRIKGQVEALERLLERRQGPVIIPSAVISDALSELSATRQ